MNNCFNHAEEIIKKIRRHHQFFRRIQRLRYRRQILFPVPSSKTRMPERRMRRSSHDLKRFCRIRPFSMSVTDNHAWEILSLPKAFSRFLKPFCGIMWFHFNHKPLKEGRLCPFTPAQYAEYEEKILPLLIKADSPCKEPSI